jgi:hypothetical protein
MAAIRCVVPCIGPCIAVSKSRRLTNLCPVRLRNNPDKRAARLPGSEPDQQTAGEHDIVLHAPADGKIVIGLSGIEVAHLQAETNWYFPDAMDCAGVDAAAELQRARVCPYPKRDCGGRSIKAATHARPNLSTNRALADSRGATLRRSKPTWHQCVLPAGHRSSNIHVLWLVSGVRQTFRLRE